MKKLLIKGLSLVLLLSVGVSLVACGKSKETSTKTIVVGSKDFTENLILSEIYALALEDNGYKVERKFNISSSVVHKAITSKEIDLYPEYTGTGLLSVLKHDLVTDPQKVYDIVKEEYKKQFNIDWLNYASANDAQGLVINTAIADKYGIKTISDLQKNADNFKNRVTVV